MYKYEEPSIFSGTRGAALIAVIILHIGIVWAFYTGLAGKLIQKIIPPVEISQIDKPKDVDKPPPPPPKLEEIKPLRPAAGVRRHPGAAARDHRDHADDSGSEVAPPPVAAPPPVQHARTASRMDPKHPLKIGEEYYPDASKRAGEEGRCIVTMTVSADGRITAERFSRAPDFRAWTRPA